DRQRLLQLLQARPLLPLSVTVGRAILARLVCIVTVLGCGRIAADHAVFETAPTEDAGTAEAGDAGADLDGVAAEALPDASAETGPIFCTYDIAGLGGGPADADAADRDAQIFQCRPGEICGHGQLGNDYYSCCKPDLYCHYP